MVAACVGIFLIFGLISYEPKSYSDYLMDMRTGGSARRWHAAFELSKKLSHQQDIRPASKPVSMEPGFVQSLLALYEQSKHDDPRLREYLALCLGYVQGPGVRAALVESLSDVDPVLRFYAVWSLAVQRDTDCLPRLLDMLAKEDNELRKVIVYSLGGLGDKRALPALKEELNDSQPDIQWNAALALARFQDAAGLAILLKMLDRDYLNQISGMNEKQKESAMINAIKAQAFLRDTSLTNKIETLSKQDSNLKVREAALQMLKTKS